MTLLVKQGQAPHTVLEGTSAVHGDCHPGKCMLTGGTLVKQGRHVTTHDLRPGRPEEVTSSYTGSGRCQIEFRAACREGQSATYRRSEGPPSACEHGRSRQKSAQDGDRERSRHSQNRFHEDGSCKPHRHWRGNRVHRSEPESERESLQWREVGTPPPLIGSRGRAWPEKSWLPFLGARRLIVLIKDKGVTTAERTVQVCWSSQKT